MSKYQPEQKHVRRRARGRLPSWVRRQTSEFLGNTTLDLSVKHVPTEDFVTDVVEPIPLQTSTKGKRLKLVGESEE